MTHLRTSKTPSKIDQALNRLHAMTPPGKTISQRQLAEECGCALFNIRYIEIRATAKLLMGFCLIALERLFDAGADDEQLSNVWGAYLLCKKVASKPSRAALESAQQAYKKAFPV